MLGIQDVNKIFGWAIFDLRRIKTKHMHKHEEGSDTRIELQMEIDFLRSMMFYREEAMLDQAYMEKCYDIFMRTWDRGGLTLVNTKYFDFGKNLMKEVSTALTKTKLQSNLNVCESAKKELLADKELFGNFCTISKNYKELLKKTRKKIFEELMEKVVNVKFSDVMRTVREDETTRGSEKKPTDLNTRTFLESLNAMKEYKKRKRDDNDEKEAPRNDVD